MDPLTYQTYQTCTIHSFKITGSYMIFFNFYLDDIDDTCKLALSKYTIIYIKGTKLSSE